MYQEYFCDGVAAGARFEELKAFRARYGHFDVPPKWDENPALGQWVARLRACRVVPTTP